MGTLAADISKLESNHQSALRWFEQRTGQVIHWPAPLDDGTFLVNKAKGIHKPAGWRYALSIRQNLKSPYSDGEPEHRADGSWSFKYFQELNDPDMRDRAFTNRGLLSCLMDGVPVAVLRQMTPKPRSTYEILGLARVVDWDAGYFTLEGYVHGKALTAAAVLTDHLFNLGDARERISASMVMRQGGAFFRAMMMDAYEGMCAISSCKTAEVLEAAHIVPYLGKATNRLHNGVLLRADLHLLFDRGLLSLDASSFKVKLNESIRASDYDRFHDTAFRLPRGANPDHVAEMIRIRADLAHRQMRP